MKPVQCAGIHALPYKFKPYKYNVPLST